ncbi:MAG: NAD(P)-binding domain-containing protein [Clostridiales bacterium]|nr:NAD(P)-binding domain-containing protein [Clostridiales bacterium]
MKVGIIGYGSMGRMLALKFLESGKVSKDDLFVTTRTKEKLNELKDRAVICSSNPDAAGNSDLLFICLRPGDIKAVLEEIKPVLKEETLVISLNGSVTFELLERIIDHKIAKVIPSVTAEINRSQTLVCYNDKVTDEDKLLLKDILSSIGNVIELPEKEMGMGSELVSCMPGFIASMFDVVCSSAKDHTEIPDDQIVNMVLNTLSATSDLMLQKKMTFKEVVDRVATKGGITEVGSQVIYEKFPPTSDEMFEKTLEKRRITSAKAEDQMRGSS